MTESAKESGRRAWVERQERWRDEEEKFVVDKAAASTPEERQQVNNDFAARRRQHRLEDEAAGRRGPGPSIRMRQIMWARWLEIAVAHELEARDAFRQLVDRQHLDPLLREFRACLVSIGAVASTFEALYGDIKYLIPVQTVVKPRYKAISVALTKAFGPSQRDAQEMAGELNWLFDRRDFGVHPYTEAESPAVHPVGLNSGTEHVHFNALICGRAVNAVIRVLSWAEQPPRPLNNWIKRWSNDRASYFTKVVHPLEASRSAAPLPNPG
jgi:hypothetical protein